MAPAMAAPQLAAPQGANPLAGALAAPLNRPDNTELLERSWQQLDAELRALDQLLPLEPEPPVRDVLSTPQLPPNLLRANQPAQGALQPAQSSPAPPLDLPSPQQLAEGPIAGLSLEQALAIAFANSASLQAQREQVASALASLQAALGTYWPTISAFASGGYERSRSTETALAPNDNLGFGPLFSGTGLLTPSNPSLPSTQPQQGLPTAGPFYVPEGGWVKANSGTSAFEGGSS